MRRIDRIVVPSRGRHGVARWVSRSAAADIGRETDRPVSRVPLRPSFGTRRGTLRAIPSSGRGTA
jgi:hypothetical protein